MTEVLAQLDRLYHNDLQAAAAAPRPQVIAAARRPGLRLAQVLETLVGGYAERPALGQRTTTVRADPVSGRMVRHLEPAFETVSYGRLWSDVAAIAAAWAGGDDPVGPGDFVATIGFASSDYLTIDLVAGYMGLVAVPLQHNSPVSRLRPILVESEPQVVTVAADYLDLAVAAIRDVPSVRRLVVFDLDTRIDDHREALERAQQALADTPVRVDTLAAVIERGRRLPTPPPYTGGSDDRLALILYTSGSTGTPKGAMWTEAMVATLWTTDFFGSAGAPVIETSFMPLNHLGARIPLSAVFQNGGMNFFVPESDLSTLLDDFTLVRPTHLTLVPRVVDMLYQRYQTRVERLIADGKDPATADVGAKDEIRDDLLGGRVLGGFISTAPLSAEMRLFLESTLGIHLVDGYGLTETGGVTSDGAVLRPPVLDYKLVDVPELGYFTTDRPHPRGELLVKTQTATPGYYKRPEVTAEAFDADGYYRTGDVMAETGPDHLVYVDRRTNVIKLSQGEFVAVANLESVYAAAALVRQIFVYGNSERAALLAVIVPTPQASERYAGDPAGLKEALWQSLRATAADAELASYEIPVDFVVEPEPFTAANGLLSGVGKLLRPNLKKHYGDRLEQLYRNLDDARSDELRALHSVAARQPVIDTVMQAAAALLGLPGATPTPEAHFTDLGGDSLSAVSFSTLLGEVFAVQVPVGVIISATADLATVAAYIDDARSTQVRRATAATVHATPADAVLASELTLDKFIDETTLNAAPELAAPAGRPRTVLLTGGNGYLGWFVLLEWLRRMAADDGTVIALIRGADREAAHDRLAHAFTDTDPALRREFHALARKHLEVINADVAEDGLGLSRQTWDRLAVEVDLIVHCAALVNHRLPYDQLFGPNVVGTAEVIRLAITERIKPVNYISTVAVALGVSGFVEDGDIRAISPRRVVDDGYANGYGVSKWAAEVLLRNAHDLCGLPVSVFRSDMILAHREVAGAINVPDQFTRLIISLLLTGIAPRSFYVEGADGARPRAHYPGLPVDFVATAISAIGSRTQGGFRSYDVMNPHDDGVSLDVFVDWLIDDGATITRIDDYTAWLARFEAALHALPERRRQSSLLNLLDAYRAPQQPVAGALMPTAVFRQAVRSARIDDIPHLDRALIRKYVIDLTSLAAI